MWVMDMERQLKGAELPSTMEKWSKHCIFRVPQRLRNGSNVFRPRTVALGPFHHGDKALHPMEEHKLRAVHHLLHRSGRSLGEVAAAVEEVAEELEDAYAGLDAQWRGWNRGRFLEMMVTDGCFLLEVMRNHPRLKDWQKKASGGETSLHEKDYPYARSDPVFGQHAIEHISSFVQRDMLKIENQLPLILLKRIVTAETGEAPRDSWINDLVLNFVCANEECDAKVGPALGLHPLDVYRQSLLSSRTSAQENSNEESHITLCCLPPPPSERATNNLGGFVPEMATRANQQLRKTMLCCKREKKKERAAPRSAQKLWEAGIRFKRSDTDCLDNVAFHTCSRKLYMPRVMLDDSTEHKYHNVMAFEALYAGSNGNGVTGYVLFMRDLVDSADDVELLRKEGVLAQDIAGSDWAVVRLLNRLTRDVAKTKTSKSKPCEVRRKVEGYCDSSSRVFIYSSWAKLKSTYLSSPWAFIALVVTVLLLATDIMQTSYAVMSYELDKSQARMSKGR